METTQARRKEGAAVDNPTTGTGGTVSRALAGAGGGIVLQGKLLSQLCEKMHGRAPRLMCGMKYRIYRDPVAVAHRWLRRFVGGVWHKGGSHVGRMNYGPGIAFPGFRNDAGRPISATLLRAMEGGEL